MSHINIRLLDKIFHTAAGTMKAVKNQLAGGEYGKRQEERIKKTPEGREILRRIKGGKL